MPKRTDIKKILIIGSGPIVIGQACEFDYSGTQACKALISEGYEVVLVNSNPATIMTDPELAHSTYIEPLNPYFLEKIIAKERPDAILPTMGGQTALNLTVALAESGVIEKYGVELIGANIKAIRKAEDRDLFKQAMTSIGLEVAKSAAVSTMAAGLEVIKDIGFPVILRPAYTLGGTGGSIAYNIEEFNNLLAIALDLSPINQVLVEESVIGWKEFELELMRDTADNVVIICSIENLDPMGIHTGDSITVAPAQTLTDKEYQRMRDAAIAVIREIGVDTGGSNIQFALNPENGRMLIIEMNPRVSRSSALASKATGFPIAKIAAKLAVGLRLDEIPNDITKKTPASFEPTIDYVVTKIPRFTFEKFPETEALLSIQMKSVGEVMAIGRTFKESIHKAIRSLETDTYGFDNLPYDIDILKKRLTKPLPERLWDVAMALRLGISIDEIYEATKIDPWFLNNIKEIIDLEVIIKKSIYPISSQLLRTAKEFGFSDRTIGELTSQKEGDIRNLRKQYGIIPVYKMVDTCAAEFETTTPYLYSTYERPFYRLINGKPTEKTCQCEVPPSEREKIIILGSGPNRIGQGIEFDYCCVHAVFALSELGYETIMINCNPETVSTDYDTANRLYFEPLTFEDVLNVIERENPIGVILQFGGQTPLKLAKLLEKAGVKILGTTPDAIDRAEDRRRFSSLITKLGLKQPVSYTVMSADEAVESANKIGYPVMLRPSYVLGGRAMEIVYDEETLRQYMAKAVKVSFEHPVLIDKYLEEAIEVDVDALCDGHDVIIGGVMQHIEEAGIHSGDSACSLPPYALPPSIVEEIKTQARELALELEVIGLMNVQFAVKDNTVYILEVNPRGSRTVPFVSKATGLPLAKVAAKLMTGLTLKGLGITKDIDIKHVAVKEAVFPFDKFVGVDTILGPEMKSTGEVMGIDDDFGTAFAKSQSASYNIIPLSGKILISVRKSDRKAIVETARVFIENGFSLISTKGTARYLREQGLRVEIINKVTEGRPHIVDIIKNKEISYIINTVEGAQAKKDSLAIRTTALQYKVPYTTTISGAEAAAHAIFKLKSKEMGIKTIQDYHRVK
ncbi:MAG: carbamoyl-phosphate synthase large subunit [Nitrospirae bacterium]|nr:carbamoyl-phosphate synthase large subunit [Nitrospirota bacterium]MBF0539904.1 carbamoyl-phosphate synthase large subunit [Nitrospirota bacterium]